MQSKDVDCVEVFTSQVSYVYQDRGGEWPGDNGMRETSLNTEFIASDPGEAIDMAVLHAQERLKNCMSEMYEKCSLGCIKVGTKVIARFAPDGATRTRNHAAFFEWKCDYPGTMQDWIDKAKHNLHLG